MQSNLHKSEQAWSRFRARTNKGERAHRAKMHHKPKPRPRGCGCECCRGGFCGGCGHAGCGGR
jgi:hypothetical protein